MVQVWRGKSTQPSLRKQTAAGTAAAIAGLVTDWTR